MTTDENISFLIEYNEDQELEQQELEQQELEQEQINNIHDFNLFINEDMGEYQALNLHYKMNYTIKDLLLICDYYGLAKEIKSNKYNKEEIVNLLVIFETNILNNHIVCARKNMWYYMEQLKNDKFMKKYVIW